MKIILIILLILAAIIAVLVYRWNRVTHLSKESIYGPFVIKADAYTRNAINMNYGTVKQTSVEFSVWHDGKQVQFPGSLQSNTGLPFLWKVYAVEGTPVPTLIAGSQSLYTIKLLDNRPVVELLHSQFHDFATLQFLDSDHGQPGPVVEVFGTNNINNMEKMDTLAGGRLLLVNNSIVFDILTNEKWPLKNESTTVENYSYDARNGVIITSPDYSSLVYRAEFQTWNTNDTNYIPHALAVLNYKDSTSYLVPFDDTDTRLLSYFKIDRGWIESRFEWKKQPDSSFILTLKSIQSPYPWQGTYEARDNYFYLYPVKSSMLPVFLDFVLQHMNWTKVNILLDETKEYSGRTINLGDENTKLDIVYREDDQKISLSKNLYLRESEIDMSKYNALVKKVATDFNETLTSGKYQEHFGEIIIKRY